jgi:hypothetical protein
VNAWHVNICNCEGKQVEERSASEYEVEEILGDKKKGRQVLYFVRWKGYSESENSWEPLENLQGCKHLIDRYEVSQSDA